MWQLLLLRSYSDISAARNETERQRAMKRKCLLAIAAGLHENARVYSSFTGRCCSAVQKPISDPVFWKTIVSYNGWLLQQNIITDHARILDPSGVRRAWGYLSDLRLKFEIITKNG